MGKVYQNERYRRVAEIDDRRWPCRDPAELGDGQGRRTEHPTELPVTIEDLAEVDHHGRAAWEAVLQPTADYDPRCSCCPLLFSAQSEGQLAESSGQPPRQQRFADAHRVRLDRATGVCVLTEELGGERSGSGHDLLIEAVDELVADQLFVERAARR